MNGIVFDIGGTHLRIARAESGALRDMERVDTPKDPHAAVEAFAAYCETHELEAGSVAAGGFAGMVRDGVILEAPNLPGWDGFDLAAALRERCGFSIARLFNDAEVAGVGEALLGAGNGYRVVGYITVSTGIGGALIIDGAPAPHGIGYEPGHQIIDLETMHTLEGLAGGMSLKKEFGAPPEELPRDILASRARALAAGLYNVIRIWSPEVLVLGGSLMNDETGYPLDLVKKDLESLPVKLPPLPPIVHSALGDEAGLRGAALLL